MKRKFRLIRMQWAFGEEHMRKMSGRKEEGSDIRQCHMFQPRRNVASTILHTILIVLCVSAVWQAVPFRERIERVQMRPTHFDYCFLKHEVKDDAAVTLVGIDKASGVILAHVVPEKGTRLDWVSCRLEQDVRRFVHHGGIVLKSEGEPAAQDLMNELARKRKDMPTVIEVSKPYDSKSNGRAESAIRRLECQLRTSKIATERTLGIVMDVQSPFVSWIVDYAADVLTKCSVGEDGRIPYERIKQKKYHGEMIDFGSMVMVKLQGKL